MKPPEDVQRELVALWLAKADEDLDAANHLLKEGGRFRGVVAFHCQQAAEKYLKAFLVRNQVEFPKTHDIGKLLSSAVTVDASLRAEIQDADSLTPYGVEVRYPSDAPELLPGEDVEAAAIAVAPAMPYGRG